MISICGKLLHVQRAATCEAGICSKLNDVARVLEVEKDAILTCLQRAALRPQVVEGEEVLDEACLSFVIMQFRPAQWVEVCTEMKRCSNKLWSGNEEGRNESNKDEFEEEEDEDEDETPVRTVIKLKSRRLNNVEDQEERELEVTLPKSFSRQQFTKQYALRDYDIGPTLQRELESLQDFWMKPFCSARQAKPVGTTTFGKRRERILCFMGFLVMYRCVEDRNDLTLMLYGEWHAFESYLCYLKEVRMLSAATVAESITAAVFVSKWLCREVENPGCNFADVELVRRYRDWRNQQASMAIRERRDETWDELREQSKWLHWDEYCRATQLMRDKFEGHTKANQDAVTLKGAKLLHDALLLAMFQALPARSGEVRLLEYMSEEDVRAAKGNLTFRQYVDRERLNLLTKRDGKWIMFLAQYKTFRHQGVDVTEFDSEQLHADLVHLLELWLGTYRSVTVVGVAPLHHRFVFVTRGGKPFGESYFSEYLARLICKLTGQSVGANLLRSSFISYFYNSDKQEDSQQTPAVRESVAKAMRHSVREAERTYDRRTTLEKKRKGMETLALASSLSLRKGKQ